MTALTREQTPVAVADETGVEVRKAEIGGGMSVGYLKLPGGTDFSIPLKGMPDDLCQCPHWGVLTKGRIRVRTRHGEETYEAGQSYFWAPGHAPEVLEDAELTEFSPTAEFDEVIDHIKSQVT
jgi:hypothetical protein